MVGYVHWEMQILMHASQTHSSSARIAEMNKRISQASALAIIGTSVGSFFYTKSILALRRVDRISTESVPESNPQVSSKTLPDRLKTMDNADRNADNRISRLQEQQQQLIDIISHELRTPLTVVYGYLQSALRRSNNLTSAQRKGLEIATQETDRTIKLLQELLEQGRLDNDYTDFDWENLDLNILVMEVVEMVRDSPMPMPSITLEVFNSPITIAGDRTRLKQAVMWIIDYMLDRSNPQSDISIGLDLKGNRAILQISDRSRDIPLEEQANLFDRFYRINVARPAAASGGDRSLATAKMSIEGMNGTIAVRSRCGEGSTFTISLPAVV